MAVLNRPCTSTAFFDPGRPGKVRGEKTHPCSAHGRRAPGNLMIPGRATSSSVESLSGRHVLAESEGSKRGVRLLMGLNPPQIRPYPYFKSPNYHPPRPTPSAQCPNPPQPEVTMEDDMRLTCRSTTIAPQPVPTRLCRQPNPPQPIS